MNDFGAQNTVRNGYPQILDAGSKTISFNITLKSTSTNYGYLSSEIDSLTSLVNGTGADITITPNNGSNDASLLGFARFWRNCPFQITRINLRATASTLPTGIVFRTYNPFNGTYSNQRIDVAANLISTQFQSGIVTLATDVMVGRFTDIVFEGTVATLSSLGVDFTISYFASLEEALSDFLGSNR